MIELKNGDTLVFLGDSITDCGRDESGVWNLGTGYPNIFSGLFRVVYPEILVKFVNKGVSGEQTIHLLSRLQSDVLDQHPDVVTLMIGANDVWRFFDQPALKTGVLAEEYRENLKKIIEPILASGAKMLIMTPYLVDTNPNEPMRAKMLKYAEICKQTAEEYNVEVLELQPVFEALMEKGVTSYELSPDRVHPTQKGHSAIVLELMKRIKGKTAQE